MRNEARCGICDVWLKCGLSNHNKGKRHLALYAAILERIETINLSQGKLSAQSILVDERDEQSKQSKQQ